MKKLYLQIELLSDAAAGRGDGVAGLIDAEIEHDRDGIPFLRGRTLKGLLVEECANILFALEYPDNLTNAARFLFGEPGSGLNTDGEMLVGEAHLPRGLRRLIKRAVAKDKLKKDDVLESFTTVRRQTAIDVKGAAKKGSLRSMRVALRETVFVSELIFQKKPDDDAIQFLTACAASLRRMGLARNRGRGKINVLLSDEPESGFQQFTSEQLKKFEEAVI